MAITATDTFTARECELSATCIYDDRLFLGRVPHVDVGIVITQSSIAVQRDHVFIESWFNL